jgi:glycosyltransferase involved in cell wall biosynthesis
VLDNPVDLTRFDASRLGPIRGSLDEPVMTVLGQITPWKGQETAIRALGLVRRRFPLARLRIVGEIKFGSAATRLDNHAYLRRLHDVVRELSLEGSVEFLGHRRDVPEILASSTLLLAPSEEEPFGRSVAEAMAAGTPVIATSVGGPAELIEDGRSGLLVAPADPQAWAEAACRLLGDPEFATQIGARAIRVARERFDPDLHARRVLEIYSSLL